MVLTGEVLFPGLDLDSGLDWTLDSGLDSCIVALLTRAFSEARLTIAYIVAKLVSLFHSETQDFRRCLTPNFDNLTPKLCQG